VEIVKVVCPSHKRPDNVAAKNAVTNLILCVAESQAPAYEEHNPELEIVTHPDDVIGLHAKRQWIYQHFGDVFMVDDDVVRLRDLQSPGGTPYYVDPDVAYQHVQQTAWIAQQLGVYLFGFNHVMRPEMSHPMDPYRFTGYIPGHSTGILKGSRLYWNPELKTTDDYWISCLNAYHHRKVVKDLRFVWDQKDTFRGKGGQSDHRTMNVERESTAILRKYFGNVIQKKRDSHVAKRKHEEQRTLKLPF
jgi:hypothetical protein